MSTEQGSWSSGAGPYGRDGDEAGENALRLLDNLLAPKASMPFARDETPRWDETDRRGFDYLRALHGDMDCIDASWEDNGLRTGEVMDPWHALTAALPFSEAERYWMIEARRKSWRTRADFPETIAGAEATVISAGLRQVLHGRDLVRRWASWRREADEFAGQGSLTRTLFLLDHLAYELVPDQFTNPDFRDQYPHVAEFDARAS